MPLSLIWINFDPSWISNHIPSKVWDEIICPLSNFNDVWEWKSNFTLHFIMDVITYSCESYCILSFLLIALSHQLDYSQGGVTVFLSQISTLHSRTWGITQMWLQQYNIHHLVILSPEIRPVPYTPQCVRDISHTAPFCNRNVRMQYPIMHHFITEMCTHVHILAIK